MIIIQARSTSQRFPGKILERFGDTFMLDFLYKKCAELEATIIAIPKNDHCIPYLRTANIPYFEGPEDDLITRYYEAAKCFKMDWVIRITADCPLLNPANILYTLFLMGKYRPDYITNCNGSCVDGQEVELLSFNALKWLNENVTEPHHREHVTTWIKENRKEFSKNHEVVTWRDNVPVDGTPKMSVDTIDDLHRCRKIYSQLEEAWNLQY